VTNTFQDDPEEGLSVEALIGQVKGALDEKVKERKISAPTDREQARKLCIAAQRIIKVDTATTSLRGRWSADTPSDESSVSAVVPTVEEVLDMCAAVDSIHASLPQESLSLSLPHSNQGETGSLSDRYSKALEGVNALRERAAKARERVQEVRAQLAGLDAVEKRVREAEALYAL
ncbi:hypothetical protein KIPB_010757, partial [Kipferlia bialata]